MSDRLTNEDLDNLIVDLRPFNGCNEFDRAVVAINQLRGQLAASMAGEDELAHKLCAHEQYQWMAGWRVNPFKPSPAIEAYQKRRSHD